MDGKITSFTQLRTWQKAKQFAVIIYKFTDKFPDKEKYGLMSQMQRASVSVAANIAEGFSRSGRKEKINFYNFALGSLSETLSHAFIALDLGYIGKTDIIKIETLAGELQKMINGLIKTAQGRNP